MPQINPAERGASLGVPSAIFLTFILLAGCAEIRDPVEIRFPERWLTGELSDSSMSLAYGPPASDNLSILFICDAESRAISTHFSWLVLDLPEGATVPVYLSSGGRKLSLVGRVRHYEDSLDTVSIEADGPSRDELAGLLGDGTELAMTVSTYRDEIPLEGVAEAAKSFLDFCAPS